MSWVDEAKKVFDIDEEKVEKAASVDVADGGYLTLPKVGEEILILFTRDPIKVESEKLKNDYGIDATMFGRVKKVRRENGSYVVGDAEYDVPMGKSFVFSLVTSCKKHGIENESLVGKVFLVTKNRVDREGQVQEMYRVSYKPDITKIVSGGAVEDVVEAGELEL